MMRKIRVISTYRYMEARFSLLLKLATISLFFCIEIALAKPTSDKIQRAFCPFHLTKAKELFEGDSHHGFSLREIETEFKKRTSRYGKCQKIDRESEDNYKLIFEKASIPLELIGEEKIEDLKIGLASPRKDSWDEISRSFEKEFSGGSLYFSQEENSLLVVKDREVNLLKNHQIFVLAALEEKIKMNRKAEDEVIEWNIPFSLSSFGFLKDWPNGTKITVQTLRNLVLFESDPTATDLLAQWIGKKAVSEEAKSNSEFPYFLEYAYLNQNELSSYNKDLVSKIKVPVEIDLIAPAKKPNLGWFASNKSLCQSALKLKGRIENLKTASSEHDRSELQEIGKWDQFFSKTAHANRGHQSLIVGRPSKSTPWVCLSLTINNQSEIDEDFLIELKYRILRKIHPSS